MVIVDRSESYNQREWLNYIKMSDGLCDTKVSCNIKGSLYSLIVRPAMLHGIETWTAITRGNQNKMDVSEMNMLR